MKSRPPEKTVLLLTALAAATALALGGGPLVREVLLCSVLAIGLGLVVAVIPLIALALLLRVIRTPLDAVPEIPLAAKSEDSGARPGRLESRPVAI
jgi:hypothetical protein